MNQVTTDIEAHLAVTGTAVRRQPEGIRRTVAGGAARGAQAYLKLAESRYVEALASMDAATIVEFPNTAYYLPVIHSITGHKVEKLEDMRWVLDKAAAMIPAAPAEKLWLPYLGATLDAGMAALWLAEIIKALKYVGIGVPAVHGSALRMTSSCAPAAWSSSTGRPLALRPSPAERQTWRPRWRWRARCSRSRSTCSSRGSREGTRSPGSCTKVG